MEDDDDSYESRLRRRRRNAAIDGLRTTPRRSVLGSLLQISGLRRQVTAIEAETSKLRALEDRDHAARDAYMAHERLNPDRLQDAVDEERRKEMVDRARTQDALNKAEATLEDWEEDREDMKLEREVHRRRLRKELSDLEDTEHVREKRSEAELWKKFHQLQSQIAELEAKPQAREEAGKPMGEAELEAHDREIEILQARLYKVDRQLRELDDD